MYTKPKLVCPLLQLRKKYVAWKITKVANFAVQYLKTPKFSPGYALELNCSYRAYAYATESPGPTFPHFWSYSACKNDFFAPFSAVLAIKTILWGNISTKSSHCHLKCQKDLSTAIICHLKLNYDDIWLSAEYKQFPLT